MSNKKQEQYTEKQHFVPKYYLRQFSNKDKYGMVYTYHLYSKFCGKQKVDSICYINNLYEAWSLSKRDKDSLIPNMIEHRFCDYEGKYDKLLKKINKVCKSSKEGSLILYSDEKPSFYSLIANLIIRNPLYLNYHTLNRINPSGLTISTGGSLNSLLNSIFSSDQINSIQAKLPDIDFNKVKLDEDISIHDLINKLFDNNILEETIINAVGLLYPNDVISYLQHLNMIFLFSSDMEFITTSNPVNFMMPYKSDKVTYLSLSSNVAVMFSENDMFSCNKNKLKYVDHKTVDYFNKMSISNCIKDRQKSSYIIGSSEKIINRYIPYIISKMNWKNFKK